MRTASATNCPAGAVQLTTGVYGGGDATGDDVCVPAGNSVIIAGGESWNTMTVLGTVQVGNENSCGSTSAYGVTLAAGGTIAAGGSVELWSSSSCDEGGDTSLTISSGTLDNAGTLSASSLSDISTCSVVPCSSGGNRYLTGSVTNTGTVSSTWQLYLAGPGTFDNEGATQITTADGGCQGAIDVQGTGVTFENGPSGTLTSSGLTGCAGSTTGNMAMPGGNTFIENGPIDSASGTVVDLTGDTLEYTGAGAGAIEVFGDTTLSGNIAADQTLVLYGSSGFCEAPVANVTAAAGFTNAGTISGDCGPGPASLTVSSGTLDNTGQIATYPVGLNVSGNVANTGTVSIGNDTVAYGGGTFLNEGALDINSSSGAFAVAAGSGATFSNSSKGTVSIDGSFTVGGGNVVDEAGPITVASGGSVPLLVSDTLNYEGKGASTIEVQGTTTLSGNIGRKQTIELYAPSGFCQAPGATVTAAAGFTNSGTIDTTCGNGTATISLTSGKILNLGTIKTYPGPLTVQATVENHGTLSAGYNSSLTISALSNYNATTQTLTGGTYIANSTSNCSGIVVPGMDIATNHATIEIYGGCPPLSDGSGSSLSGLSDNAGTLDIGQSANEAINLAGSLTNSGTIELGEDNDIHLNGNYEQTSTGRLATIVGGTSATYTYGQLEIAGTATLAGTFAITKDPAYTPSVGDTQQVVTFSSSTGTFKTVTGRSIGGGLYFALQYTSSAAQLVVTKT